MKIRISERNPKVVFVEGNVFNKTFYDIFKLDVLAPFVKDGYTAQYATYQEFEKQGVDCNFEPCIRKNYIGLNEAKQILETHLNNLINKGYKRIAICPIPVAELNGHEADEFYMKLIYEWMEERNNEIEFLFLFDISISTNIVEQNI